MLLIQYQLPALAFNQTQQHAHRLHICLQAVIALLEAAADGSVTQLTELLRQPHITKHINSTDEEQRCEWQGCRR